MFPPPGAGCRVWNLPASARATPMIPRNGASGTTAGAIERVARSSSSHTKKNGSLNRSERNPQAGHDVRPTPALVSNVEHLDLQRVARPRVLDEDGTGQRVAMPVLAPQKVGELGMPVHLSVDRIAAREAHGVAVANAQDWRPVAIPRVVDVRRQGREGMLSHSEVGFEATD